MSDFPAMPEASSSTNAAIRKRSNNLFKILQIQSRGLFELRYALSFLSFLIMWPFAIAFIAPQALVANAMMLNTYTQLGFVVCLNFVACVFAIALLRRLNTHVKPKPLSWVHRIFGDASDSWNVQQFGVAFLSSLPLPMVLCTIYPSEFSGLADQDLSSTSSVLHFVYSFLTILASLALAWVLVRSTAFVKTTLFGSERGADNFFPYENISKIGVFHPLVNKTKESLRPIGFTAADLQFTLYGTLLICIHILFTRSTGEAIFRFTSPPLVAIIFALSIFVWLCGLAYWLDKWKFPVVPFMLLLMIVNTLVWDTQHTLDVINAPIPNDFLQSFSKLNHIKSSNSQERLVESIQVVATMEDAAASAITSRLTKATKNQNNPDAKKPVAVVVSCPGGGIHAAAWTTYVLEKLSHEYENFRESIVVISGVSGGSVGTMFFVANSMDYRENSASTPAFNLATQSSLEAIFSGMVTDDLYGLVLPPMCQKDRGKRLEMSLESRHVMASKNLDEWGVLARRGAIPIVALNATDIVSGRRVIFDSIPTPSWRNRFGLNSQPYNYRELLIDHSAHSQAALDVSVAAATRVSATFPYVSPFVSMPTGDVGKQVALGDGGYSDNDGLLTALDWIRFLLSYNEEKGREKQFSKILLLRIAPKSETDFGDIQSASLLTKSMRRITGPMEALISVRGTSQAERSRLECLLLENYSQEKPTANEVNDTQFTQQNNDQKSRSFVKQEYWGQNKAREIATIKKSLSQKREYQRDNAPEGPKPNSAATTSTINERIDNVIENQQVIVAEIIFEPPNKDFIIPLNWKLNKSQKEMYAEAWDFARRNQTDEFTILNRLFPGQRATKNTEPR